MDISLVFIFIIITSFIVVGRFLIVSTSSTSKLKHIVKCYEEGNIEEAIKEINLLDPKYKKESNIMWMTANIYYRQQQYILAMVTLQNMIEMNAFSPEISEVAARELLAVIYNETGNVKQSIAEHAMIVALNDNSFTSLFEAGRVCYNHKEWLQAQKYFIAAMQQSDNNPEVAYLLSDSYYKIRSFAAAASNIQKAIMLDANNHSYHFLYGKILYAEKNYAGAINEFAKALENAPENEKKEISLFMGNTYFEIKKYDLACEYYATILHNDEEKSNEILIDDRYRYAESLIATKNLEKAVEQWRTIKNIRGIYLDVDSKLKTYSKIIGNAVFRKALESDIVDYLENYLYRILTLNGYIITEYNKKSESLIFFLTIKKFGSEGQSYKNTFALDISGHPVRQESIVMFNDYVKANKSSHSYIMSVGGFDSRLVVDETTILIEPDRFEAIMEGVISFSN